MSRQLLLFKQIYRTAPFIETAFQVSTSDAYDYCKQRRYFAITIPYTIDKQLLVERTFFGQDIKWSLIGGSLRRSSNEDFLGAADRLAEYSLPGINLADIEPFAFVENRFHFNDSNCIHEGIAFIGRIRNLDVATGIANSERTRGHLVDCEIDPESFALPHNKTLMRQAQKHISAKATGDVPFHEFEISQNERFRHRYAIHSRFVKPAMRFASTFIGATNIASLNRVTYDTIFEGMPKSLIDVACGENTMCEELSEEGKLDVIVGNDVSYSQIELLRRTASGNSRNANLLYTNHNALNMPFADKTFDVAVCKNVLHHMPDGNSVRRLIQECARIAKKAVIIEVMDPAFESCWGRLRHRYYVDFLHDAFVHFYSQQEFEAAINDSVTCVKRFDIKTFRGIYQFAVVTRE